MSGELATIQAYQVGRRFGSRHNSHVAVDSVSLIVDTSSRLGVVGESGSGKSTLVRLLVGLERATSGSIEYRGQSVSTMGPDDMRTFRRAVQLIGQDTSSSFDPRRSIRDAIRRPAQELRGMSRAEADHVVDEKLVLLGLDPGLADRRPHQISGGQRQRCAIARALVVEPSIIVCDEVVSALDVSVQGSILNLLKDYCATHDAGLVFVSHGLPATAFIADEILVMHQGNIVERGPTERILLASEHPYTTSLIAAHRGPSDAGARHAELVAR